MRRWGAIKYDINQWIKTHIRKRHLKLAAIGTPALALIIYGLTLLDYAALFPIDEEVVDPATVAQTEEKPKSIFATLDAKKTNEDVREIMTAEQSSFYWQTFLIMMEHAKPLEHKEYDGNVIQIAYQADAKFKAENGHTCRPYSEKVAMAGRINTRKGIACRKGPGYWCRQPVGETAKCRAPNPSGDFDSTMLDYRITMHNFGIGWDRNLSSLSSF